MSSQKDQEQSKLKKRLESMLKLPENQLCADCRKRGMYCLYVMSNSSIFSYEPIITVSQDLDGRLLILEYSFVLNVLEFIEI